MTRFIQFTQDCECVILQPNQPELATDRNFWKGERLAIANIDCAIDEEDSIIENLSHVQLRNGDIISYLSKDLYELVV